MITAFLTMQWLPAHVHLADNHDHNGSHHGHEIEVHAHQPKNLHDNSIDSSHQPDHNKVNVVELECEYNTQSGKKLDDHLIASTQDFFKLRHFSRTGSLESPESNTFKYSYLDYSTIHLRAPPKSA